MIDPNSTMFPVLGAAHAAGVSYAVALAWVEASRDPRALLDEAWATERVDAAWQAGVAEFGEAAMIVLHDHLTAAARARRIAEPSHMSVRAAAVPGGLSAEEMRLLGTWRHVSDAELAAMIAAGDHSIEVRAVRRRVAALRKRVRGLV